MGGDDEDKKGYLNVDVDYKSDDNEYDHCGDDYIHLLLTVS